MNPTKTAAGIKNCLFKAILLLSFLSVSFSNAAQIKPTTADERQKGMVVRKALEQKSLLKEAKFRNIGPTVMSGRVTDVEVNPQDPTEFYVAYASGGLWQTKNNGQSFTPLFDKEDVMTIGDIAVKWYGSSRVIWVGTGEVNSSRSSYAGNGVYKSSDLGKTWEYLGLPESHHIGKIQLHPTDPNTAWVAALGHLYSPNKERGVYKTTDGGKTWQLTLAVDENTGAVEMDINPNNPNELYAAMWHRTRRGWAFTESGPTSGIYKSTDGGNSWTLMTVPGSGFAEGKKLGRIGLSVYAQNPNIVYAVIDNYDAALDTSKKQNSDTSLQLKDFKTLTADQFLNMENSKLDTFMRKQRFPAKYTAAVVKEMVKAGKIQPVALWDYFDAGDDGFSGSVKGCEVYRSDDAGKTWKLINNKLPSVHSTYGYYFAKIYVSPVNADKLIVLGVNVWMSTDGGKSFKNIEGRNVHSDHHAMWINPKKESHMINGNDGGINITYDDGANWFKANTPSVAQFYAITVDDAKPYNVYGGLQDNGSWYGPSNNRETVDWHDNGNYAFKSIGGGDGMQVQVDTRDNKTVYAGSQFGAYARVDKTNVFQSRVNVRPQHELGDKPLRFNWQSPILLSKHNQDIFYFGTNRFHRSLNKGEQSVNMSGDLTGGKRDGNVPFGTLVTISESPLRFGLIYTGSDDGFIHVSKDGGYSWTAIHSKLPKTVQGLYVSRVVASKYKESRVYVTLNGYRNDHFNAWVFVSDDYGTTWKQLFTDLPAEPVNVLREDPKNENLLYVGTDHGLYVSVDGGFSSMAWMSELPRVAIHDMAIQERENEIVLGTHGRGIYIASLAEAQKLAADKAYYEKKKSEVK